jgi:integrase
MKLTTQIARTLELPAGKDDHIEWDDELGGFGVRLRRGAKSASRKWCCQYSIGPKTRRITFGNAMAMAEPEARRSAAKLLAEVRLGGDPAARKSEARNAAAETFGTVLQTYLPIKRAKIKASSYAGVEHHLLVLYRPLHGHSLRLITGGNVSGQYERIAKERGGTAANNSWRSARAFFDWCVRQGLIDRNPALAVERRPDRTRDRWLTPAEIRVLWSATEDDTDYSAILRLLLLTGCRATEIAHLRWSELFADQIVLPGERVKNGRTHVLPITSTVRAILDSRPRRPGKDFVFGRAADRPFTGWGASKAALDERIRTAGVTMPPWVTHDLRRTCASGLAELGIQPATVEAVLNHVSGFRHGVAGVYNRFDYARPIRNALEAWDNRIREIVRGDAAGDRVVALGS